MPERIYLACPYSHPDVWVREARFEVVTYAAAQLMRQGCTVFSPVSLGHAFCLASELPGDFTFWRESCFSYLQHWATCLTVLKLAGWESSEGVKAEIRFAQERNLPVNTLDFNQCRNSVSDGLRL